MSPKEQLERMRRRAENDGRYAPEAFWFVSEAIGQTAQWLRDGAIQENNRGPRGEGEGSVFHVSGQELLVGIRRLAKERWGMMTPRVFERWGVRRTEDFGEIVFLMVDDQELQWRKRETDTKEDFANGFDIQTAFGGLD
jgi:uncharacterized repeat protein (TIGR04138 family)